MSVLDISMPNWPHFHSLQPGYETDHSQKFKKLVDPDLGFCFVKKHSEELVIAA